MIGSVLCDGKHKFEQPTTAARFTQDRDDPTGGSRPARGYDISCGCLLAVDGENVRYSWRYHTLYMYDTARGICIYARGSWTRPGEYSFCQGCKGETEQKSIKRLRFGCLSTYVGGSGLKGIFHLGRWPNLLVLDRGQVCELTAQVRIAECHYTGNYLPDLPTGRRHFKTISLGPSRGD